MLVVSLRALSIFPLLFAIFLISPNDNHCRSGRQKPPNTLT